jgi:catecholate siderophore receptor
MVVTRNQLDADSTETYLTDQLDLTAKFSTGFLHHTLVTGAEVDRETSDPVRPKFTNVPTTSLLDPDPYQAFSGTEIMSSIVHTTANTAAVYALDTVQLARKWQLIGGLRRDRFNAHYTEQITASAYNQLTEMPTWRAGIVYKPVQIGSLYVSAGTSFNPSAEMLALSAATASLPPETNRTIEAGTKWDLLKSRLSLTGAIFDTIKTNAREPDPTNSLIDVLAGNQRVNGSQVGIRGHLTSRWELLTSYAYLDGKVVSSTYYPASVGAQLANVPRDTFNIWTTCRLPRNWGEIGGGSNYVSSRTASSTAPDDPTTGLVREVPGYWVFNAMAEHRLNEHVRLQGNIYNIANKEYFDQLHPGHIILGPGRSALIGLKFNF